MGGSWWIFQAFFENLNDEKFESRYVLFRNADCMLFVFACGYSLRL